jgi:hypothetical protein
MSDIITQVKEIMAITTPDAAITVIIMPETSIVAIIIPEHSAQARLHSCSSISHLPSLAMSG